MSQSHNALDTPEALRKALPKSRLWWAPVICLVFLVICSWISGIFSPRAQETPTAVPAVTFTQLIPEGSGTPIRATISISGETYELQSMEDGYALPGESIALDSNAAKELLATGASITSRQTLQGDPAGYGIQDGCDQVVYTYADGSELTLLLGSAVPTGEGWYAAIAGTDAVYVVNNALHRTLYAGKNALYALPDLSQYFTAQTLLSATIVQPGKETVTITRVTEANPFNTVVELTQPIHYPANSERAAEVYLALEALTPSGVAAVAGEDAAWGLDSPVATLILQDKETTTLTIGQAKGLYTLRVNDDPTVYTLDGTRLDFLQSVTVPYLAEQLPGLVALNQVTALRLTAGEETYRFTTDQSNHVYTLNGQSLDEEVFLPVYQQMIGLLIERYTQDTDASATARVRLDYTLKDGSSWSLLLVPYDEQFDLIVREDCACFLISRAKVDAMVDAVRGLLL